jgi:ribosome-binding ATPase YchF (GTP1/OBG family)
MNTSGQELQNPTEPVPLTREYGVDPLYPADIVTKLQVQLSAISSLMIDSTALHLKAPPIPSNSNAPRNEEAEKTMKNVRDEAKELGKKFVKACVDFERMLDEIPGVNSTEDEQIEQLIDLNRKNDEEAQKLLKSVSLAGMYSHFRLTQCRRYFRFC